EFRLVSSDVRLHSSTSPSRKTRSQGTRTSSKKTIASISSKREPKGWSKWERPRSKLSRHCNFTPGVLQGMAKAKEYRACASGRGWGVPGGDNGSHYADGASAARHPRA